MRPPGSPFRTGGGRRWHGVKIVFLAPFGIRPKGTVQARMVPLAVELQRLGHRVTVILPPYTNPEDSGVSEEVEGVLLRNVALGPRHKVLAAPLLAWRMLRATLAEKPDLVHLFKPKGYGGLAAMLLLGLGSLGLRFPPLLLDTDDWEGEGGMNDLHPYGSLEKRFYRFQERWLTRRAAGVTVASLGLRRMTAQLGVPQERIFYLPNGVRPARRGEGASVRERLGIDPAAPVLLLYTRFFEFDQERVYRVFSEVCRRVPALRLLVVGKGRRGEEAALQEAARSRGFDRALVLAGWVEPSEIPDFLAAADLAVYPLDDTLLNRCKCPAKLTELLLAEVPVVADRVGQATQYVEPEISGRLSDPSRWESMAEEVISLLEDPQRRRLLGREGRRRILSSFSWRDFAAGLDTFYGEHVTR